MQMFMSKAVITNYLVTLISDISLNTCTSECESRDNCALVVYDRRLKFCELHSDAADQPSNLKLVPGKVTVTGLTCNQCPGGQQTKECPVTDEFLNAQGNMFSVTNSRLADVVLSDSAVTTRISCDQSGKWFIDCSGCTGCQDELERDDIGLGYNCPRRVRHPLCSCDSDGQGWLVFQRRFDGSVDFYRNWDAYVHGFGDATSGEYWLGLENLHRTISKFPGEFELRIDMEMFNGTKYYAVYTTFDLAAGINNYRLTIDHYSGDAGDSLALQNGMMFSTKDKDNDIWPRNCASSYSGAWWYAACHNSNLNGLYYPNGNYIDTRADHIHWFTATTHRHSLRKTEMKVRRRG